MHGRIVAFDVMHILSVNWRLACSAGGLKDEGTKIESFAFVDLLLQSLCARVAPETYLKVARTHGYETNPTASYESHSSDSRSLIGQVVE
jgi:hypothetical protein